jgi:serine protease
MPKLTILLVALGFFIVDPFFQVLAQGQDLDIIEGPTDPLPPAGPPNRAANQLVVKFRPGVPANVIQGLNTTLGARVLKVQPLSGLRRLNFPAGSNLGQILAAYRNSPMVEEAGYNYVVRAFGVPNDEYYYPYQWHLHNTVGGMWAEDAWDLSPNKGQNVIVAVIDTGVAFEGNGPFVQAPDLNQTFVSPRNFTAITPNDTHANDDNGHGTHVAGTICQETNNSLATAGIAYECSLMPLKVLGYDGSGLSDDLNEAIYYAADNGADVINMSLGFQGTGSTGPSGETCTEIVGLNAALDYAYAHNIVIVAAAGNDGGDIVNCPAAHPKVISVGATRFDGQRTSYSTGGDELDITAPGGDLGVDQNIDGYGDGVLQVTFCYDYFTMWLYYNLYGLNLYTEFCSVFYQGTSMATPHVAGTAALILGENSSLTNDQVRFCLKSTARDYGTPGWDSGYGWGLLDADSALRECAGAQEPPAPPPDPETGDLSGNVMAEGNPLGGATVTATNGTATFTTTTLPDGSYQFFNLVCGSYDVTASAKKYADQTHPTDVCLDTALDFDLQKKGGGSGNGGGGGRGKNR